MKMKMQGSGDASSLQESMQTSIQASIEA